MNDPTRTIPKRSGYTPDSDKPPRRSNRATVVASRMSATRKANRVPAFLVGLAILGVTGLLMVKHPPAGWQDQAAHGAWAFVALALMGFVEIVVDALKSLLAVIGPYLPWSKQDGAP